MKMTKSLTVNIILRVMEYNVFSTLLLQEDMTYD